MRDDGRIERQVDLSGIADPRLKLKAKLKSFESTDEVHLKVSPDGVNFTTVYIFNDTFDDGTYHPYEFDLSDFEGSANVTIVFDGLMSTTSDYLYLDDVEITGVPAH